MPSRRPKIDKTKIHDFCRKWKISELALFGSIVRNDFNEKSDVDVLVTFLPNPGWGLYEYLDMRREA